MKNNTPVDAFSNALPVLPKQKEHFFHYHKSVSVNDLLVALFPDLTSDSPHASRDVRNIKNQFPGLIAFNPIPFGRE